MRKYDNFCKALENLGIGAELEEPYSVVEQTGIAALFGICFEQSWKLMKALLEESGRTAHGFSESHNQNSLRMRLDKRSGGLA